MSEEITQTKKSLLKEIKDIPENVTKLVTEDDIVCSGFDIDKLTPEKIGRITRTTAYFRLMRYQRKTKEEAYRIAFKGVYPEDTHSSALRARASSLERGQTFKQIAAYNSSNLDLTFASKTLQIIDKMAEIALDDAQGARSQTEAAKVFASMVQLPELEKDKTEVANKIVSEIAGIADRIDATIEEKAKMLSDGNITAAELLS